MMKTYDSYDIENCVDTPTGCFDWVPEDIAQELYDSLKWIIENYPHRGGDSYPNPEWWEKANAAIKKADGKEEVK